MSGSKGYTLKGGGGTSVTLVISTSTTSSTLFSYNYPFAPEELPLCWGLLEVIDLVAEPL